MTVRELIEQLNSLPQDIEVGVAKDESGDYIEEITCVGNGDGMYAIIHCPCLYTY